MPYLIVPQDSAIIINCTTDHDTPHWTINFKLANDPTTSQYQFSSRRKELNALGMYESPRIETPGMPPTLRLLINDTSVNNQATIHCVGNNKSHDTMLTTSLEFGKLIKFSQHWFNH